MGTYYLAVDIGASSGRHILGHLENGQMVLEEIYRFENGMDKQGGKLLWDTGRLQDYKSRAADCKRSGEQAWRAFWHY